MYKQTLLRELTDTDPLSSQQQLEQTHTWTSYDTQTAKHKYQFRGVLFSRMLPQSMLLRGLLRPLLRPIRNQALLPS